MVRGAGGCGRPALGCCCFLGLEEEAGCEGAARGPGNGAGAMGGLSLSNQPGPAVICRVCELDALVSSENCGLAVLPNEQPVMSGSSGSERGRLWAHPRLHGLILTPVLCGGWLED